MDTFGPINAALIVVMTIVFAWYLKDRFDAVDKRLDAHDERLDAQSERLDSFAKEQAETRADIAKEQAETRADIAKEQAEIKADVAALKTMFAVLQGRLEELSREVVGLRADLTQIALVLGARTRPETA